MVDIHSSAFVTTKTTLALYTRESEIWAGRTGPGPLELRSRHQTISEFEVKTADLVLAVHSGYSVKRIQRGIARCSCPLLLNYSYACCIYGQKPRFRDAALLVTTG